jgi:hypothetical protein
VAAAGYPWRSVRRNNSLSDKYDKWINDSQRWQNALQEKLNQHGGNDLVAAHSDIAFAFPSRDPHPYSFDLPRIDDVALLECVELGT